MALELRAEEPATPQPDWLGAASEMRDRIRAYDWARTPLGPIDEWPQSLKTAVGVILGAGHAMQLAWGPARTVLYNDAYAPMLANRHPDALGLPFDQAWPDVWPAIEPLVRRVFAGDTVKHQRFPLTMTRKGYPEETWWDFCYSPVRDETGAVAGLLNVTTDASMRVQAERAEAALRDSEQRLRQVLGRMGEGFTLLDRDMRIIMVNDAALQLDGRPHDQIVGHTHWDAYPGSENSEIGRLYRLALAEKVSVSLEHRYEWPRGGASWLEMRAYPIAEGLAVFCRDITAKKDAESALRLSEERFRQAVEAADAGTWSVDLGGGEFTASTRALELHGLPPGTRLTHAQALACIHPDDRAKVELAVRRTLDTGEPFRLEVRIPQPDGSVRWVASYAHRRKHSARAILVGLVQDITERKRQDEQVQLLMREVDHRSNNMLALIQSIASLTAARAPTDFVRHFGERIKALSASQNLLVQNAWRAVPVMDLVRSQLAFLTDGLGARIFASGPATRVTAAASQAIGMALHELATNAAKYGALSEDRGRVEIHWFIRPADSGAQFVLSWAECQGPPVAEPKRMGFGTSVTMTMIRRALDAEVERDFAATGIRWQIVCPADRVVDRPAAGLALT